jgi:glycosyltransferase involved in cell wall biosynthesis
VRIDPFVRRTARRASKVLAATPDTAGFVSRSFSRDAETCLAIGWDGETAPPRQDQGPLKAIYVGRLIYWKGVHLALEALAAAEASRRGMTLTIVGKGPERERLQQMVSDLGLENVVRFEGQVPESEVNALLREHNAFLFPSFQDSGAFAVLEAMAQRLPVVALKSGGPAVLVSEDTGITIEPHSPKQTVSELRDALIRLHEDPQLRGRLGNAGAQRAVEVFSWDRLGAVIDELYGSLRVSAAIESAPVFAGTQRSPEAR